MPYCTKWLLTWHFWRSGDIGCLQINAVAEQLLELAGDSAVESPNWDCSPNTHKINHWHGEVEGNCCLLQRMEQGVKQSVHNSRLSVDVGEFTMAALAPVDQWWEAYRASWIMAFSQKAAKISWDNGTHKNLGSAWVLPGFGSSVRSWPEPGAFSQKLQALKKPHATAAHGKPVGAKDLTDLSRAATSMWQTNQSPPHGLTTCLSTTYQMLTPQETWGFSDNLLLSGVKFWLMSTSVLPPPTRQWLVPCRVSRLRCWGTSAETNVNLTCPGYRRPPNGKK